ncbi:MAG: HDOD domain-containing protein [Gallionellaceae bacterium]|nr:HDOD domain-containing protein [Gallionellaceae bacterium]
MNKINVAELVKGVDGLVTLPDVFVRISQLVDDPDSTITDVANAVSQYPSFAVRLLRVANSPFCGFSSSATDTVAKAVSLIGASQIRNLALSASIMRVFAGLPNNLVSKGNFWRHSIYCALVARILAKRMGKCEPEAVFTAGLLHDIGELVIFNRLPEQAKGALLLVLDSADELPMHEAERQIMGFDHAQVGGELARQWQLHPMLEECIACHHDIQQAQQYPRETALVHIANILSQMAELDTLDTGDVQPIEPLAWEITGLDAEEIIGPTVREAQAGIIEAEKFFLGNY